MQSLWRDYEWRRTKFNGELAARGEEVQAQTTLEEIYEWEDFAMRNFGLWLQPDSQNFTGHVGTFTGGREPVRHEKVRADLA